MKKFQKIIVFGILALMCTASSVFAVPVKEDSSDTDIQITVKDKETSSPKASAEATATVKPSAKATTTAKATATAKTSAKPSASATTKATAKASSTAKATSTATSKADDEDDKIILDSEEDALVVETTLEPVLNIENNTQQLENKKYLTKGGAFLWFLFTVIVSAVISFAISYRFYMMGKRDNHVIAELRALKRDIDKKMVGTVNGFSEFDVSVTNSNRSYARPESSIRSGNAAEVEEKSEEIYKKWESQISRPREASYESRPSYTRSASAPERSRGVERRTPVRKNSFIGKIKSALNEFIPTDRK